MPLVFSAESLSYLGFLLMLRDTMTKAALLPPFIENRFIIQLDYSFSSLYSSKFLPTPLPYRSIPLVSLIRKEQASKVSHSACLTVFVLICYRRKLLRWWLNKALISEYSRILSGVILPLLCLVKNSSIWSYGRSLGYLVSGSWSSKQCWVWAPSHRVS